MRIKKKVAAAIAVTAASAAIVPSALAGTSNYCQPCGIPQNAIVTDPTAHNIVSNYVHYLGSGDRHIGTGVQQYTSLWAWHVNEASISYTNPVKGNGAAGQDPAWSQYSTVTVNAHDSF